MNRSKMMLGLFAGVSILSFTAALIPVLKGGQMNVVFLGSGVVFLILAMVIAKKARPPSGGPPAA